MKRLISRLKGKAFNKFGTIGCILLAMVLLSWQNAGAGDLTIVGSFTTPGVPKSITVNGDYGYLADGSNGLQVVDVRDPSNPVIVGSVDTEGTALSVVPSGNGNHVYLADYDKGVVVIDVSVPTSPVIVGSFKEVIYALDVDVSGNYAYVADYAYKLHILDVSDPSKPSKLKSVDMPGPALGVFVTGTKAYVACAQAGLQIVNISNPSEATIAGGVSLSYARDVFVAGSYAYVANQLAGFAVVNVSNSTAPFIVGTLKGNAPVNSVFVTGNLAFLGSGSEGLVAVDISDPTKPKVQDSLFMLGGVRSVYVQGIYIYAVTERYYVNVVVNQIKVQVGGRLKVGVTPLANFPVKLLKKVGNEWKAARTVTTDAQGYYNAVIKAPGEILTRARDIILTSQAAINGEVTYNGAPFPSAPARLFRISGDKYIHVKTVSTDINGKYNFGKRNAGTYRVDIRIGPPF